MAGQDRPGIGRRDRVPISTRTVRAPVVVFLGLMVSPVAGFSGEVSPVPGPDRSRSYVGAGSLTAIPRDAADMPFDVIATRHPDGPDRAGRRSDTMHFFAYQLGAIGILYAMPEDVTGWTDEEKEEYSLSKWWSNVRNPQWDSDDFYLNYILHPYWGAAYYVRSRERGYDSRASFWYAAGLSTVYEFGAEALFEEPSIQDLIVTPLGGWLVGDYFMQVRERIAARNRDAEDLPFQDRFVLVMTDPLGAINRTVDGWFGLEDDTLTLMPVSYRSPLPASSGPLQTERVYGLRIELRW